MPPCHLQLDTLFSPWHFIAPHHHGLCCLGILKSLRYSLDNNEAAARDLSSGLRGTLQAVKLTVAEGRKLHSTLLGF